MKVEIGLPTARLKAASAGPAVAPTAIAATATVAAMRRGREVRVGRVEPDPAVGPSWSSSAVSSDLREPGKAVTTHQPRKSAVAPRASQLRSAIQYAGRPT